MNLVAALLDGLPLPSKPLPALLVDQFGRAERLVQIILVHVRGSTCEAGCPAAAFIVRPSFWAPRRMISKLWRRRNFPC
jgi:hypothetical protein